MKKVVMIMLSLMLLVLYCADISVGCAEELSEEDVFWFEPEVLNGLDYFDDDEWYDSSYGRTLFTVMLITDLSIENDDFDFDNIVNGAYVSKEGLSSPIYTVSIKTTDNGIDCISYDSSEGFAAYVRFDDGLSGFFLEDALDEISYSYYRIDINELADVAGELNELNFYDIDDKEDLITEFNKLISGT